MPGHRKRPWPLALLIGSGKFQILCKCWKNWEAQQDSEPSFDIDTHAIDGKPFVRVTFPDGKEETIYGFNTRADAIKWIRCEAIVWLYEHYKKKKTIGVA
jgi:hypothetical protein